jgi:hypothetical protein
MTGAEKVLDWMLKFYTRNGTPNFSEIISQLEMAIEEELEVKNSVVLADVSQQSELLNNFSSWLNQEYKLNIPPDKDDVNRYLKNYK